jgi:DNA modification methylase
MDVDRDLHYVADGLITHNCWYAVRKGKRGHWAGDRKQATVWAVAHPKSETGHGTQKPVECMKRPIENNSSPGQAVYEPFCGSGTTIIAAEMTGRVCHAIELLPQYVDVAVERWQAFTGSEARLEDGGTFAAVAAERRLGAPKGQQRPNGKRE